MLGFTAALLLVLSAAQPYAATVNGKPITEPEVARAIRDHLR